jgi:hypothetical protein
LAFKDGDLVAQGKNLDVFVPIAHRQQPQHGEGVRDGEIGQAEEHERSSCRARPPFDSRNGRTPEGTGQAGDLRG